MSFDTYSCDYYTRKGITDRTAGHTVIDEPNVTINTWDYDREVQTSITLTHSVYDYWIDSTTVMSDKFMTYVDEDNWSDATCTDIVSVDGSSLQLIYNWAIGDASFTIDT